MIGLKRDEAGFNENPHRRNRINLSDYDYERDIRHRILMSQLTLFEVSALTELVDGSLNTSKSELADMVDADEQDLEPLLDKLSECGLLTVEGKDISVDKDLRRYYETQLEKFDEDFHPGVSYLKGLLTKVPIQHLPVWYPIPRTSDNIFQSILERFLETPKIYSAYLEELTLDDPVLEGIRETVFSSPKQAVCSRELREKFDLTRAEFEEAMLHLEFNMVCFLSYIQDGDRWREVVTPLYEWTEYLKSKNELSRCIIKDQDAVEAAYRQEFAFIDCMSATLQRLIDAPASAGTRSTPPTLYPFTVDEDMDADLLQQTWAKCLQLGFIGIEEGMILVSPAGQEWQQMSTYDRAMAIYRHPHNWSVSWGLDPNLCTERNIRTAEKSLRPLIDKGWIDFETFMEQLTVPLGSSGPIQLKRIRRGVWKYVTPEYSDQEKELVYRTIFNRLHEIGMVQVGSYEGKPCFRTTTFGQISLGA